MVKTFHTTEQLLQILQASLAQHEDIVWELEEQENGFVIRSKDQEFNIGEWQTPIRALQLTMVEDALAQSFEIGLMKKLNSLDVTKTSELDRVMESILKEVVDNISKTLSDTIIQKHNKKNDDTVSNEDEDLEQWITHFTTKYDETLRKLATS